jgi:hypothetical protein
MRQEVNLLVPGLLPPVERLPLWQAGAVLGAWGLLLAGVSGWHHYRISSIEDALVEAKRRSVAAEVEVTRLSVVNDRSRERAALTTELERLLGEHAEQKRVLDLMERETETIGRGSFSSYLTGVAESHVPGLWITGITVDFRNDTLLIRGAAQQPVHVPGFVTQLRSSDAFAGTTLDGIQVRADEEGGVGFELRGAPG